MSLKNGHLREQETTMPTNESDAAQICNPKWNGAKHIITRGAVSHAVAHERRDRASVSRDALHLYHETLVAFDTSK